MRRIFYRVRRVKRYSLLIALGLFLMLAFPVYASGGSRFTLPVTITWGQGGLNKDKTYQLALKGLDEGCPMPDGSQEEYCVTLTRDKTITQLPEIRFEKPGDYHYVLTMTREDQKQIAVYYLHVMAVNGENGELTVTSTLREKDPQGTKTDELRFADDEGKKLEKEPEKKTEDKAGQKSSRQKPSETGTRVQTGDENEAVFWIILLLAGITGLGAAVTQLLLDRKVK